MAHGVNKVILVSNLGADQETHYIPSRIAVTNVRIATSEAWKDEESGEQKESTEWQCDGSTTEQMSIQTSLCCYTLTRAANSFLGFSHAAVVLSEVFSINFEIKS